jgi:hypothetical protein
LGIFRYVIFENGDVGFASDMDFYGFREIVKSVETIKAGLKAIGAGTIFIKGEDGVLTWRFDSYGSTSLNLPKGERDRDEDVLKSVLTDILYDSGKEEG